MRDKQIQSSERHRAIWRQWWVVQSVNKLCHLPLCDLALYVLLQPPLCVSPRSLSPNFVCDLALCLGGVDIQQATARPLQERTQQPSVYTFVRQDSRISLPDCDARWRFRLQDNPQREGGCSPGIPGASRVQYKKRCMYCCTVARMYCCAA